MIGEPLLSPFREQVLLEPYLLPKDYVFKLKDQKF
jgi:hypothetical protein